MEFKVFGDKINSSVAEGFLGVVRLIGVGRESIKLVFCSLACFNFAILSRSNCSLSRFFRAS
jgi:hypothetical protein